MSRVQCIDCGVAVVIDPNGLCPDGHFVGADGARIEAAIGVAVPYPDEPEPWVSTVEADDPSASDDVEAHGTTTAVRTPRAPTAPGATSTSSAGEAGGPADAPPTRASAPSPSKNGHRGPDASDTDDLLRELHSLSDDLAGGGAPPHVRVPPRPDAAPPSPAPTAAPAISPFTSAPAPEEPAPYDATPEPGAPSGTDLSDPSGTTHVDGLAELRALEAAVHALTGGDPDPTGSDEPRADETGADEPSPPAPAIPDEAGNGVVTRLPQPTDRSDGPDRDQLAEVEELFARRPRPLTEDAPPARPSQAIPSHQDPPRPAFERTPWSSLPVEEPGTEPPSPAAHQPAPAAAPGRHRRSATTSATADHEDPIDLGNFTAKGGRVKRAEARRRKRR